MPRTAPPLWAIGHIRSSALTGLCAVHSARTFALSARNGVTSRCLAYPPAKPTAEALWIHSLCRKAVGTSRARSALSQARGWG